MTEMKIEKIESVGYDNSYEIDIKTTKSLTQDEYVAIVTAINTISAVLDPYLEQLREQKRQQQLKKEQEEKEEEERLAEEKRILAEQQAQVRTINDTETI